MISNGDKVGNLCWPQETILGPLPLRHSDPVSHSSLSDCYASLWLYSLSLATQFQLKVDLSHHILLVNYKRLARWTL